MVPLVLATAGDHLPPLENLRKIWLLPKSQQETKRKTQPPFTTQKMRKRTSQPQQLALQEGLYHYVGFSNEREFTNIWNHVRPVLSQVKYLGCKTFTKLIPLIPKLDI